MLAQECKWGWQMGIAGSLQSHEVEIEFVTMYDIALSGTLCCGNEDPYPFACSDCGHPMLYCGECDTMHPDLSDVGVRSQSKTFVDHSADPPFRCPDCGYGFEPSFLSNPAYRVRFGDWIASGYAEFLRHDGSTKGRLKVFEDDLRRTEQHIRRLRTSETRREVVRASLGPAKAHRKWLQDQIKALDGG